MNVGQWHHHRWRRRRTISLGVLGRIRWRSGACGRRFAPFRDIGGSGVDKEMLIRQAESVGRRWFGCGGHFEGESMCRSHQLMRNGAVNQPERPSTPNQRRRPVRATRLDLILRGLVNQRVGGREPSNAVVGAEITWGVAMLWVLSNLTNLGGRIGLSKSAMTGRGH